MTVMSEVGSGSPTRIHATLKDVAAHAGVSAATVSNALNHPSRVAPATLTRVHTAIRQLGFVRNTAASTLATGASHVLGLVVIDLMNSLFVDIARGAQGVARAAGYALQLSDSANDADQEQAHLRFLHGAHAAGIILTPIGSPDDAVRRLRARGDVVVLANYFAQSTACCTAIVDNDAAGYIAARHLIERGCRRIALVGGLHDAQPVVMRRRGILRALGEEHGAVTLLDIATPDLEPPSGTRAGRQIARMPEATRPDAVLAVTDLLAMAVISEFARTGIRIPADIAVMGCDHNSAAWGGAVPLTSVAMNGHDVGRAAVELLLAELGEPRRGHTHRTVRIAPTLIARESTIGR